MKRAGSSDIKVESNGGRIHECVLECVWVLERKKKDESKTKLSQSPVATCTTFITSDLYKKTH